MSRKGTFFNLDDVLNVENYNILPEQESSQFHYTDSKGPFAMNWHTTKEYQSGRAPKTLRHENFLKNQTRLWRPAHNVANLTEAFGLFVIDDILNSMVDYTNANTEFFRLTFKEVIEQSGK